MNSKKHLGHLHLKADVMYLLNIFLISVLGSGLFHMYSNGLIGILVNLLLFISFNATSTKFLNTRMKDSEEIILQKLSNNYKMFAVLVIFTVKIYYLAYFI